MLKGKYDGCIDSQMVGSDFFEEQQPWGTTRYHVIPETYTSIYTNRASVDIFTNPFFGRMLFIDGVLQSAESDEKKYHSEIVSYGFSSKPHDSMRFLVAGGAEGAIVREVLGFNEKVKEVVMVDWDEELVQYMSKYEEWSKGAFEDSRVKLVYDDINSYLEGDTSLYDSIILDLLDPTEMDDVDFTSRIILKACKNLRNNGAIVCNAGGDLVTVKYIVDTLHALSKGPLSITYKSIDVPSFQEPWFLLRVSIVSVVDRLNYVI